MKRCLAVPGLDVNALVDAKIPEPEKEHEDSWWKYPSPVAMAKRNPVFVRYARTALMAAARVGRTDDVGREVMRLLIEARADPHEPDTEGVCAVELQVTQFLFLVFRVFVVRLLLTSIRR